MQQQQNCQCHDYKTTTVRVINVYQVHEFILSFYDKLINILLRLSHMG
jgi:hypothetical protein